MPVSPLFDTALVAPDLSHHTTATKILDSPALPYGNLLGVVLDSSLYTELLTRFRVVQESEGNILDDDVLINTLNNSKLTAGKQTNPIHVTLCISHAFL